MLLTVHHFLNKRKKLKKMVNEMEIKSNQILWSQSFLQTDKKRKKLGKSRVENGQTKLIWSYFYAIF